MIKTGFLFPVLASGVLYLAASQADQSPNTQDTMSCGDGFVQIGDSEVDVLSKCGEPTYREGDRWTYDRGPGKFVEIVNFGEGNIMSIIQGPRD